jgi:hypothetical protein
MVGTTSALGKNPRKATNSIDRIFGHGIARPTLHRVARVAGNRISSQ